VELFGLVGKALLYLTFITPSVEPDAATKAGATRFTLLDAQTPEGKALLGREIESYPKS